MISLDELGAAALVSLFDAVKGGATLTVDGSERPIITASLQQGGTLLEARSGDLNASLLGLAAEWRRIRTAS